MFTKLGHDAALKKVAEVEAADRQAAVELGFALAAKEAGLNEAQYSKIYDLAVQFVNR